MAYVMIWDPYERFLWGMAILLLFILAFQYLKVEMKNENFEEKLISYGYSTLFFGFAFHCLFFILAELQMQGTYINNAFYSNYNDVYLLYELFMRLSLFSLYFGFILYLYAFERILKRTKYLITLSDLIVLILMMVFPLDLAYFIHLYISYGVLSIIISIILLIYTNWSRIDLKPVSSFIFLGAFLIGYSIVLSSIDSKKFNLVPLMIPPLLCILGGVICFIPKIVDPKILLKNWTLAGTLNIGVPCLLILILLYIGFPLHFLIVLIAFLIFTLFSVFYIQKKIKYGIISESKEELKEVLAVFTKPKKVTEEEVTVSKEKKICLVCKGKVARSNIYLCPECNTFYCEKCSTALSDLENACWVCNTPFDTSKPSKPFQKIEEEIEIEKNIKGKSE